MGPQRTSSCGAVRCPFADDSNASECARAHGAHRVPVRTRQISFACVGARRFERVCVRARTQPRMHACVDAVQRARMPSITDVTNALCSKLLFEHQNLLRCVHCASPTEPSSTLVRPVWCESLARPATLVGVVRQRGVLAGGRALDSTEGSLAKECENGRIARLLFKLGFINERPEYALAPQWAETGDR